MRFGFWGLNIGLVLMILISLLPIGLIQAWASVTQGLWLARSEDFMEQPLLQDFRWLQIIGDSIMIFGALAFFWQIIKISFSKKSKLVFYSPKIKTRLRERPLSCLIC